MKSLIKFLLVMIVSLSIFTCFVACNDISNYIAEVEAEAEENSEGESSECDDPNCTLC